MYCTWIIRKPCSHPWAVEKLSSTKLAPGAKKIGGHWARVSEGGFQGKELLDQWVNASIIYRLYHFPVSLTRYETISLSNKSRLSIFCIFVSHRWEIVSRYSFKSCYFNITYNLRGFPGGSDSKESACNSGDPGSIPGSGRSSGEGNDNPLQYSCLENSTDRGIWPAIIYGVAELDLTEQLTHILI